MRDDIFKKGCFEAMILTEKEKQLHLYRLLVSFFFSGVDPYMKPRDLLPFYASNKECQIFEQYMCNLSHGDHKTEEGEEHYFAPLCWAKLRSKSDSIDAIHNDQTQKSRIDAIMYGVFKGDKTLADLNKEFEDLELTEEEIDQCRNAVNPDSNGNQYWELLFKFIIEETLQRKTRSKEYYFLINSLILFVTTTMSLAAYHAPQAISLDMSSSTLAILGAFVTFTSSYMYSVSVSDETKKLASYSID